VKRIVATWATALLVGTLFTAFESAAPASATTPEFTITVDCTSETTLRSSLAPAAALSSPRVVPTVGTGPVEFVVEATVNAPFRISNSSSTGFCTASLVLGAGITGIGGTPQTVLEEGNLDLSVSSSSSFSLAAPSGSPVVLWVDTCSGLEGSGIQQNPWKIGSAANFAQISTGGCSQWGHYLQTADFGINTTGSNNVVSQFEGVYDGNHHEITYLSPPENQFNGYLFGTLNPHSTQPNLPAVIKKLRLSGKIVSNQANVSSLVGNVQAEGVISEVASSVDIEASGSLGFENVGGLVARATYSTRTGQTTTSGLIQYSSFSGAISFTGTTQPDGLSLGGLAGVASNLWIRDSYSTGSIAHTGPANYGTGRLGIGGLVGNARDSTNRILRSYSAGLYQTACVTSCSNVVVGGLVGAQTAPGGLQNNAANVVSSFWLTSSAANAFGEGTQPSAYASGLPVAVGVNAQTLSTRSTFQSKGDNSGPFGESTGANSLPTGDSTPGPTASDNDYRWAIESANVETFVAQRRVDTSNDNAGAQRVVGETLTFTRAFDRLLWTNSAVPTATYSTRGVSETVDGYPPLGRVWEICASENNGFPVLVWEDRNCHAEGTGGGGNDRNRETPSDVNLAAAQAAGLSGAELAAFLASGLTLEQWMAQRLAATGTPGEALGLGVAMAGLLTMFGMGLLAVRRRLSVNGVR
jgi:hypothetical protein